MSPTIRVNRRDIQPNYIENTCESCEDLCECEGEVECRLWQYHGEEYSTTPVGFPVESFVQAIASDGMQYSESREGQAYQLSSNVRDFFEGSGSDESTAGVVTKLRYVLTVLWLGLGWFVERLNNQRGRYVHLRESGGYSLRVLSAMLYVMLYLHVIRDAIPIDTNWYQSA